MNRTRGRHCCTRYVPARTYTPRSTNADENWNRKSDFIDENGRKKRRAYRINATPYDDHADCAKASAACSILEASATFTFHLGEARRLAARRFNSRTFARTRNGKRRTRNGGQRAGVCEGRTARRDRNTSAISVTSARSIDRVCTVPSRFGFTVVPRRIESAFERYRWKASGDAARYSSRNSWKAIVFRIFLPSTNLY